MWTVIIVVVVAVAAFFAGRASKHASPSPMAGNTGTMNSRDGGTKPSNSSSSTPTLSAAPATATTTAPAMYVDSDGYKVFTVLGQNFSFAPSEIKVNKDDKVKIIFQNADGHHDFVLDAFNVKTPVIPMGQSATLEFTANKTGTFPYYCSVGNHSAMGMWGNFIVQ